MAQSSVSVASERRASGERGERIRLAGATYMLYGEIGFSAQGEALVDTDSASALPALIVRVTAEAARDYPEHYRVKLVAWLDEAKTGDVTVARNVAGEWYVM